MQLSSPRWFQVRCTCLSMAIASCPAAISYGFLCVTHNHLKRIFCMLHWHAIRLQGSHAICNCISMSSLHGQEPRAIHKYSCARRLADGCERYPLLQSPSQANVGLGLSSSSRVTSQILGPTASQLLADISRLALARWHLDPPHSNPSRFQPSSGVEDSFHPSVCKACMSGMQVDAKLNAIAARSCLIDVVGRSAEAAAEKIPKSFKTPSGG